MQKWEYKECNPKNIVGGLNYLGKIGWELVCICPKNPYTKLDYIEYIFKRPLDGI